MLHRAIPQDKASKTSIRRVARQAKRTKRSPIIRSPHLSRVITAGTVGRAQFRIPRDLKGPEDQVWSVPLGALCIGVAAPSRIRDDKGSASA